MKRLIVGVFVATILAVWSVPALAAVEFGGQIKIRGEIRDNVNYSKNYDGVIVPNYDFFGPPTSWFEIINNSADPIYNFERVLDYIFENPEDTFDRFGRWIGSGDLEASYDDEDQAAIAQRVRLWAVARPTDDTTIKITIQDTREWGVNGSRDPNGGPWLTDENNGSCIHRHSDDPDDYVSGNLFELLGGDTGDFRNTGEDEHCNGLDIHESWVKIDDLLGFEGLSVKAGRQELNYGDQRLIGSFDWSDFGRSFDAVKLTYNSDNVDVDLFASKLADQTAGFLNSGDTNDRDQDFYGIYATIKMIPNNELDLYALWLRDTSNNQFVFNNSGRIASTFILPGMIDKTQNLYTFGARLKGALAGIDYSFELPVQTGSIDTTGTDYDISAWAFAAKFGYTLPIPQHIRVGFEYNFASGDDDYADSDIETFSNLFPSNHGHMGNMDQQGWRNMEGMGFTVAWEALSNLELHAAYWLFKLAEEEDAWYGAEHWMDVPADGTLRGARGWATKYLSFMQSVPSDKDVGTELDLVAHYKYNKSITVEAGASAFFSDDYIEDYYYGNDDYQSFGFVELTANF
ncbi:MAG: alginate export family protein [Thermodesulfobacteriota bacterium]